MAIENNVDDDEKVLYKYDEEVLKVQTYFVITKL